MFNIVNPFISISKHIKSTTSCDPGSLITELLLFLNKLDTNLCPSYREIIREFLSNSYTFSKEYLSIYSRMIKSNMYSFDNIYINNQDKIVFIFNVDNKIASYVYDKNTKEVYVDSSVFDYILLDLIEDCIEYLSNK